MATRNYLAPPLAIAIAQSGARSYMASTIIAPTPTLTPQQESECLIIQEQKKALLSALSDYFTQKIDRTNFKKSLGNIRSTLVTNCATITNCTNC
jgi:hypothetical protein